MRPDLVEVEVPVRTGVQESERSSWRPKDLAAALSGNAPIETADVLRRTDGVGLIYPHRVNAIFGETESGKTWVALAACVAEIRLGKPALFIDFEDTEATAVARLRSLGLADDAIESLFVYISPTEPLDSRGRHELEQALARGPSIAVIDGITDALQLHGLKPRDEADIARFYQLICRPIARAGPAVLTLDHVVKDKVVRGGYPIGSQHKLAGIDGAAFSVETARPFARGSTGLLKLSIAKDRRGQVRPHAIAKLIAEVQVVSDARTAEVAVIVRSPAAGVFRPTTIMERVSRALEDTMGGLSRSQLRKTVSGKGEYVDKATDILVAESFVAESFEGKTKRFTSARPYRAEDDPEASDE